jgi:signal transduction histidine kinase
MTCRIAGSDGDAERIVRVNQFEVPSKDPANAVELWLLRDATVEAEVGRLSRALERSGAQLENMRKELNQDRDELIALLSHELRTPLTVISGYNKLLLSERVGKLSDEQRHYLEASRNSCQRLNEFVADLLDAPHDRSGSLTVSLEERPVVPSIRAVIEFFLPLLEEKSLEVEIDVAGELPLGRLDPVRIEQVLTNLLGNAVKYTRVGSVIGVGARVVSGDRGPMIEVSISDDGPGITAEDSQRIFEPYVRGTGEGRDGGVGLGLAICRRILEAHAGEIWVEAVSGRGSRFVFSIPAVLQGAQVGR